MPRSGCEARVEREARWPTRLPLAGPTLAERLPAHADAILISYAAVFCGSSAIITLLYRAYRTLGLTLDV